MKKLIALLLALVMVIGLVACGEKAPAAEEKAPAADAPAAADKAPAARISEARIAVIRFIVLLLGFHSVSSGFTQSGMESKDNIKVSKRQRIER